MSELAKRLVVRTKQMKQPFPNFARELARPDNQTAARHVAATLVLFLGLLLLMTLASEWSYAAPALLSLPAGGLLARAFALQHDCGHGALFTSQLANLYVGRVLGVLTLTPFDHWRKVHAIHHRWVGNLDHRGSGDVLTLTVAEYGSLTRFKRALYRIYRHPLVLFGLGPIYLFVLKHRLPFRFRSRSDWVSTQLTNATTSVLIWLATAAAGIDVVLAILLPTIMAYGAFGVWVFFVGHQFDGTYWRRANSWTRTEAALAGSSYVALPRVLSWFLLDSEIHHLHHLNTRVPCYKLRQCLAALPDLENQALPFRKALTAHRLTLWDEELSRLVGFSRGRSDSLNRADLVQAPANLDLERCAQDSSARAPAQA